MRAEIIRHLTLPKRYPLTTLCIVLIFVLCFCHPSAIPLKLPSVIGLDKIAHFVMYTGTCSVMWTEYLRKHQRINYWRMLLLAVVAPILMSGIIEIIQGIKTNYRGADIYDFYANSFGVLMSLLIPYGWWLKQKFGTTAQEKAMK